MREEDVRRHYDTGGALARVRAALGAAGIGLEGITIEQLASIDEFHIRGRAATTELAAALAPRTGSRVLDVGSGLGGPSRYLAATYGCQVTGIDLTPDYVEAARALAGWVGFGDRVRYEIADATGLPFEAASFDYVWTQHAAMNIADKARLYGEIARVLRPGGRLALNDILQGPAGPIHFPVPWADDPAISHLVEPAELKALLQESGFALEHTVNRTDEAIAWAAERRAEAAAGRKPALSPTQLFGEQARPRFANLFRNLDEGRILVIEAIVRKP
jgi:ubiquinone/menaquinone biosynthesis C-methylase UbiE